jgi:SecD/SecF GG-like protein
MANAPDGPLSDGTPMLHFSRTRTVLIAAACVLGALLAVLSLLAPGALPAWLPQPRINLGLDLQGGSHLLLEVDMKTVLKERLTNARSEVRQALVKAQVPHRGLGLLDQGVSIQLASEHELPAARKALADLLQTRTEGGSNTLMFDDKVEGTRLILTLSPAALTDMSTKAAEQSVSIVRRRIDQTGVNEPLVARDRIERLLGSTFRLVAPEDRGRTRRRSCCPMPKGDTARSRLPFVDASKSMGRISPRQVPGRTPAQENGLSILASIASVRNVSPMSAPAMSASRLPSCSTAR